MDGAHAFRRAFHLASPLFLGFYLIPERLPADISRDAVVLLFVGAAACIELARIALGVHLFGMRPYEGNRVSAYAQGTMGLFLALYVVQDPRIVVPVFIGMAWIDPLSAVARKRGWPRWLPAGAYGALFLAVEGALGLVLPDPLSWPAVVVLAALATPAAILSEGPRIPQVDDDLLMQVVPMALLVPTFWGLQAAGLW